MRVAVVGAGIGGLAVALRLASRGHNVTVFEKNLIPGGRMSEVRASGFRFDTGPTFFTMPETVRDLFEDSKAGIEAFLKYSPLDVNSRYFLPSGKVIRMYSDRKKLREEIRKNSPEPFENIEKAIDGSGELFELAKKTLINYSDENGKPTSSVFSSSYNKLRAKSFKYIFGTAVNKINQKSFIDKDLAAIFDTFGIFTGFDPYRTNPILLQSSYSGYGTNRYFIQGGYYALIEAITKIAREKRVSFRFGSPVEQISVENGTATGVVVKGVHTPFDAVISASDIYHTTNKLLSNSNVPASGNQNSPRTDSLKGETLEKKSAYLPDANNSDHLTASALVFLWGIKKITRNTDCYNIILSADPQKEFDLIYDRKIISSDPTIAIYISSKLNKSDAPAGCENWQVRISAPVNCGQDWGTQINQSRILVMKKIYETLGVDIKKDLIYEQIISPVDLEREYGCLRGSLHGVHGKNYLSAVSDFPNKDPHINNMYYVGAGVHPGGSVTMSLLSAQIVDKIFAREHPVKLIEPTLF